MKKHFFLIFFLISYLASYADHIKGGWMYYEYVGKSPDGTKLEYKVTVKVYRNCENSDPNSNQNDKSIFITVYNSASKQQVANVTAQRVAFYPLKKTTPNPCMNNPPAVCYYILQYEAVVDLAPDAAGYTLSFQRCCRVVGIQNLQSPSNNYGNTYTTTIPGTASDASFAQNSTPKFAEKDTAIVCYNSPFTLDYSATDADGDSLVYSLCPALHGGYNDPSGAGAAPNPATPPPYSSVGYKSPYTAVDPFGTGASINSLTGIISGTAPSVAGAEYVISVCVDEFRKGIRLGTTHKELHVVVGNCTLSGAELKQPGYQLCDSATFTFQNLSPASNITSYAWSFGDPKSGASNTSTASAATHKFSDTGIYVIKLKVQNSSGCVDSTTSAASVYPGFKPNFNYSGSCFQSPFQFTDNTVSRYGIVNSWKWDFADPSSSANNSTLKNPTHQYPSSGVRTVLLTVGDNKGCMDTVSKAVIVSDVPALILPFKDTLICSVDTLQLQAIGNGVFSWTPNYNITNAGTANPLVYPKTTTSYIVTLNEKGCIKKDTLKVNVLDFITVDAGRDTSICLTDSINLHPVSQGLQYKWTPSTWLNNSNIKNPVARPLGSITYYVTAKLGKCQDVDSVKIKVAPYPKANAGGDTSICFGDKAQLQATIVGSSFTWAPVSSLINSNTLTPLASPRSTTNYILSAFDTLGCPKPFRDTVIVRVISQVKAFAGHDTSIVANQPLQLNATGGTSYLWSPPTGLTNTNIPNPVATLGANIDSITYHVRVSVPEGCFADDDITVRIFKTGPDVFVPSAFTPNGDGKNDVLRPIAVGIKSLTFFKIYNRWGQVVYASSNFEEGWNGTLGGRDQATGTYVYVAEAIDYLGKPIVKKGTVVLIR
jgi:gliding motility-associated-like protein